MAAEELDLRAEDDAAGGRRARGRAGGEDEDDDDEADGGRRVRRRGRRGDGRRGQAQAPPRAGAAAGAAGAASRKALEGTFDHGDEGYGLWLDPAIQDDPVYAEHWAGHRPVTVSVEAERIVITPRRRGSRRRRLGGLGPARAWRGARAPLRRRSRSASRGVAGEARRPPRRRVGAAPRAGRPARSAQSVLLGVEVGQLVEQKLEPSRRRSSSTTAGRPRARGRPGRLGPVAAQALLAVVPLVQRVLERRMRTARVYASGRSERQALDARRSARPRDAGPAPPSIRSGRARAAWL